MNRATPSPFPGMDPYLEEPGGWPGVHHRLISMFSDMLVDLVAPHFSVSIEERVYITDDYDPEHRRVMVPDLYVVERSLPVSGGSSSPLATPPTLIERLPTLELRDRFLTIYDRRNRELVTTLEVLSPHNKATGSRGRREFIAKREAIFSTQTHWIEVDLLRAGERPEEVAGQSDYYALLRRGQTPHRLEVWYIDVRDPLPRIIVPLRAPHPDVVLDLQAACTQLYTRTRCADDLDYSRPAPPPPLRAADQAWAAQQIAHWRATLDQPDSSSNLNTT